MTSRTAGNNQLTANDWRFRTTCEGGMVRMMACPRGVSTEEVARIVVRLNNAEIGYLNEARANGNWIVVFTKISKNCSYNHRREAVKRLKSQIIAVARPDQTLTQLFDLAFAARSSSGSTEPVVAYL